VSSASRRAPSWLTNQALALRLGFERMSFLNLTVAEAIAAEICRRRSMSLPRCMPAIPPPTTRSALRCSGRRASSCWRRAARPKWRRVLRKHKNSSLAASALAEIWRHPLHTREFGSLVTNVLRCLLLEAHGYRLNVTELVGWEHSMKNELIIARREGRAAWQCPGTRDAVAARSVLA
jgi:hypothetical protein